MRVMEKEMATHSSILVWRIPWNEEPGERLLLNDKTRDSWPPEETNSIQGQRQGWITQSFYAIKFY